MSHQYNTAYQRRERDKAYARSMAQFESAYKKEGWYECEIERFEWRKSSYMMFVKGIFKPINIKEWAQDYFGRVTKKVRDAIESNAPDIINVYCSVDTIYQQGCPYNYGGYVYRFKPSDKDMNIWMQKAFGPKHWEDIYNTMYPICEKFTKQINKCSNQMWEATWERVYSHRYVLKLSIHNRINDKFDSLYIDAIISEQDLLKKIETCMNQTFVWHDKEHPWPPKGYRSSDYRPMNMRMVAVS